MPTAENNRAAFLQTLVFAIAFAVAHTLAPLYFSNQNQYLLHGAAEAGVGLLDQDWLANTADPTPVFSALVGATYCWLGTDFFHVEYFLVLIVYFFSLAAVPGILTGRPLVPRFLYLTLLVVVHAAILRLWSVLLFDGVDYPWYFQSGVAGQYILGPSLQPSVFGVLLVTSIVAFAKDRPWLAVLCSTAAAILHPTYLLAASLLTVTFMAALARAGRWRKGLVLGAVSLLAVLPILVRSLLMFAPSTPQQFEEAQTILAQVRIPHHANLYQWLDGIALAQLAWIAVAVVLTRGTRLCWLLAGPALGGVALTLLQVASGNQTLALLFPWRVSAILVPLATAIILAQIAAALGPLLSHPRSLAIATATACTCLLAVAIGGGAVIMRNGLGYLGDDGELPLVTFVREHHHPGDVYLLPVRIPAVGSAPRGSVSTSFRQPQRLAKDAKFIPVDLQRFRLLAETPIFVDFKSIPYKDVDVLEWYRRLRLAEEWYQRNDWANPEVQKALAREGITHIVIANHDASVGAGQLDTDYGDNRYRIVRVKTTR